MNLNGVFTALITPFDRSGRPALEVLEPLLRAQEAAGVDGVVIGGTNGEAVSMSVAERCELLDRAMELKGNLSIIAGTGAASITDAKMLTQHASQSGAIAALVLPPFYYKKTVASGLEAYYRSISAVSKIPMLLYHIPQLSYTPISFDLLGRLSKVPNVVGIKDSSGMHDRVLSILDRLPEMSVFEGDERFIQSSAKAGSAGVISGIGNAWPNLVAAAFRQVDRPEGDAAQDKLSRLCETLGQYPPIAVIKTVASWAGLPFAYVRPPLRDLTKEETAELKEKLEEAGLTPQPISLKNPAANGKI